MCIWNVTGELIHKLRIDQSGLNAVVFSADGRTVFAGGDDGKAHIWLLPDGDGSVRHAELPGHDAWLTCVAISSDGQYLLTGGYDGKVRVWEIGTGTCIETLRGHVGPITSVAVSATKAFTVGGDGTIRVWNNQWTLIDQKSGFDRLIAVSSNGAVSCFATSSGEVYAGRWGNLIRLQRHRGEARAVSVRDDGIIASGGEDALVKIYRPEEDIPFQTFGVGTLIWSITMNSRYCLIGGDDSRIHIYRRS